MVPRRGAMATSLMLPAEFVQEPPPEMQGPNRQVLFRNGALGIDATAKRSSGAFSPERRTPTGCQTYARNAKQADRSRVIRESTYPRDIDNNVKRSSGGFSPLRSRSPGESADKGGRSPEWATGHLLAAESRISLQAIGLQPGIDLVQRRRAGEYSPQRVGERSCSRTSAPVEQVVDPRAESNRILGVHTLKPSIDMVQRRCVGQYSPLRHLREVTSRSAGERSPLRQQRTVPGRSDVVAGGGSPRRNAPRAGTPMGSRSRGDTTAFSRASRTPSPLPRRAPPPLLAAGMRSGGGSLEWCPKEEGPAERQPRTPEPRPRTPEPRLRTPEARARTPESGRMAGRPTHAAGAREAAKGVVPGLGPETPALKARGSGPSLSRASTADPSTPDSRPSAAGANCPTSPVPGRARSPCTGLSAWALPQAIRMPKSGADIVGPGWR
mmetsp:Transcript_25937/g.81428  ORF Transcript_25937/g.81428 Transcript_25937/m.81428 type:complete len:439 (+) Transcript_25937:26-1342(+)